MTINCGINPPKVNLDEPAVPVSWTKGTLTKLGELAKARRIALSAQADMYRSVDPIAKRSALMGEVGQELWERTVFEAGKMAYLDPRKASNVASFIADWLPFKL